MRSCPGYFTIWLPTITLCGIVTGYFLVMWSNAPRIPSQGMEALVSLPYAFASLVMAPFILGLGLLLWQHPRRAALKLAFVIPTTVLTFGAVSLYYVTPRASTATYNVPLSFVDERGQPVSDLSALLVHSSPGFDILRGRRTQREEAFKITESNFNLIKTKGEESELRIEKEGYYFTKVTIPHVWPAERNTGLQRIHFGWQKDWGVMRWNVDACQAAINWPLMPQEPLKVVLLDIHSPAQAPLPEYSEEDFRLYQEKNK